MEDIQEISLDEFIERFPDVEWCYFGDAIYLDNGVVLLEASWNGYCYEDVDSLHCYYPILAQNPLYEDDYVVVGYEQRF